MNYELRDGVAVLQWDDGKANAVGHVFLDFVNEALDKAEQDAAGAVLLIGRPGIFSAGFDLKEFSKGMEAGMAMVERGLELAIRLYAYPLPVVAACTGHAVAMGAFLLLACDTRIGTTGSFRFALPETKINMVVPQVLQVLSAARLTPAYLTRALVQSEDFDSELAVKAGFLDALVEHDALEGAAFAAALELSALPGEFYAANKLNLRKATLKEMQEELAKVQTSNIA